MLPSALPADVTNLLGDRSCHLVTVPPFGVAILFHAFVLISNSFSYPINPLAIPYVKVDYVVILRINFVLASNNSCIFRQNSFGRSGAATVYFVDQCLALTLLCYFFIKYEKKSRPFATKKKPISSVVFIAARISYTRFFTAVHIYDFYISTTIKPLILHVSPHPPHPCVNSDWFRHCCANSTTDWGRVEWRAGRLD